MSSFLQRISALDQRYTLPPTPDQLAKARMLDPTTTVAKLKETRVPISSRISETLSWYMGRLIESKATGLTNQVEYIASAIERAINEDISLVRNDQLLADWRRYQLLKAEWSQYQREEMVVDSAMIVRRLIGRYLAEGRREEARSAAQKGVRVLASSPRRLQKKVWRILLGLPLDGEVDEEYDLHLDDAGLLMDQLFDETNNGEWQDPEAAAIKSIISNGRFE